jgi:hypothetical protein
MFRLMGMFGLGGLFLLISPSLRETVMNGIEGAGKLLEANSPISYVLVGLAGLASAMMWVYKSAQPKE